jgi:hypothetical protein
LSHAGQTTLSPFPTKKETTGKAIVDPEANMGLFIRAGRFNFKYVNGLADCLDY